MLFNNKIPPNTVSEEEFRTQISAGIDKYISSGVVTEIIAYFLPGGQRPIARAAEILRERIADDLKLYTLVLLCTLRQQIITALLNCPHLELLTKGLYDAVLFLQKEQPKDIFAHSVNTQQHALWKNIEAYYIDSRAIILPYLNDLGEPDVTV